MIDSIMSYNDDPFGFSCQADDKDHAQEQCLNAYPDCDIVFVKEGHNYYETILSYTDSIELQSSLKQYFGSKQHG